MDRSIVEAKFDSLVEAGLVFYDQGQKLIEYLDEGLKFQFLLTSALAKKPTIETAGAQNQHDNDPSQPKRDGSDINTAGYEICDVGSTHVLVANKFCFARPHLMLLTSDGHQRQYEALNRDDLTAAWSVLSTMGDDYVAFFNCGRDGGCSRLHKHMQLIPMPNYNFASFLNSDDTEEPGVPFRWFFHRFGHSKPGVDDLVTIYNDLVRKATEAGQGQSENANNAPPDAAVPHNFLLTQRWMMLPPRRRAAVNGEAGANAIGMMGVIAVATRDEIESWLRIGPATALAELGFPK
ncbi:5 5 P-1 P-4-tetraphosphate phosphorylase 2 [Fusarium subglutinans]|uniref:5 5 P-1 P-4-tetraphosphate phosphorylase 2 n=1 Tax=Gibberella subglutinans TaxID=42677 RepID=A0A8H5Q556_GIBSU|nr:5 5 P-1 P-4-tetraphosphate phosphorylase 2 [Fusarium subglutinans]KAF5609760.1 5 5 P-1 P-4-tetraphosphate phosphorylase 2 [Fusarium subglutinans]